MRLDKRQMLCWLVFLVSINTNAAKSPVAFNLRADSQFSDNALKSATDDNNEKMLERQDTFEFLTNVGYNNEWCGLIANYVARNETFQKSSQEDNTYLEGRASLSLGNSSQPLGLDLTHSRMRLLTAPDALAITDNYDERDITSAKPIVRIRITPADLWTIQGNFKETRYGTELFKNSRSTGAETAWLRKLSAVDHLILTAQQSKIKFEANPLADYSYRNVKLSYEVELRRLQYKIEVGQNQSETEATQVLLSLPSYNAEITYQYGGNTIKVAASQMITDSSNGNQNNRGLGDNSLAASGIGFDIINMKTAAIYWSNSGLCERCNMSLSAVSTKEDYQSLNEDGHDNSVSGDFSYRLTRTMGLSVAFSHHERSFDLRSNHGKYTTSLGRLSLDYFFANQITAKLFVGQERRQSENALQSYDEHLTGLSLSTRF